MIDTWQTTAGLWQISRTDGEPIGDFRWIDGGRDTDPNWDEAGSDIDDVDDGHGLVAERFVAVPCFAGPDTYRREARYRIRRDDQWVTGR